MLGVPRLALRPAAVPPRRLAAGAGAAWAVVLAAVATSVLLTAVPLPAPLLLAGAAGGAAIVALALARFDTAVLVGLLLLGVVRVEPAPTDAVLAAAIAVAIATRRPELRRIPLWATAVAGLLVAVNVVSLAAATELFAAARYLAITVYLLVLALWLSAYVDRDERARAVLVAYGAAAVCSALLGVLAVLAPVPGQALLLAEGRARGLFEDPNVFGPFLVPPLLLLLHEALQPRLLARRWRPLLAGAVVLLELGVVLSFSRGAWLNLAVGLVVMAAAMCLRPGGPARALTLVVLVGAVGAAGVAALGALGESAFFEERATVQNYDAVRFGMQHEGLRIASESVTGIGPGQLEYAFVAYPHNVYIMVAVEQGLAGAVVFLALVGGTLLVALRNVLAGRDTYGIAPAALLGAWCGLLASGVFVDTLHWRHLWVVAALIWAAGVRGPGARALLAAATRRGRTMRAPVVAVLVLASVAVVLPVARSGTVTPPAGPIPPDAPAEAGDVRVVLYPDPSADRWVSRAHAAFWNEKYWRARTYSPFFDDALSWYPRAWVYQDLQAIYPGSRWARRHPEWILRDGRGRRLYVPWGCKGGTCPQYAADIGSPGFRRTWLAAAAARLRTGYRGLYVDDVNLTPHVGDGAGRRVRPVDPRTGRPMTAADWRRYMAEFTELIRRAFPRTEIVHNVMWAAGEADPHIARQIAAADYINLERGVTDEGLTGGDGKWALRTLLAYIDRLHARGRPVLLEGRGTTEAAHEYNLAAYFLISTGRDAIGGLHGATPGDWWEGYDVHLGAPASPRVEWQGVLRRDFARGAVLLNEPEAPVRVLELGPGYTRIDGTPVESIVLGPAQGAVVLRTAPP